LPSRNKMEREMTYLIRVCVCAAVVLGAAAVFGHGIPITVTVDTNNKLIASNDQPLYDQVDLTSGYAPMILVDNEDGAVMDQITFSNSNPLGLSGSYKFTTLPGFNVTGMEPDSGLFLQIIPRPVKGSQPVSERMLWHWSLSLSQSPSHPNPVAVDPSGESLVIASDPGGEIDSITVPQGGGIPPTIKVAEPTGSELGTHQHYLEYFLGNGSSADDGMYGFFARLTSPNYAPSDPFLVILDNDVYEDDYPGQILAGALAINNAALLAGDYNHDDRVDAEDYAVWRKTLGSTTALAADGSGNQHVDQADFGVWRQNFGATVAGSGLAIGDVPEPNGWVLAVVGVVGYLFALSMRSPNRPTISSRRA
jgi:hypothetical protein